MIFTAKHSNVFYVYKRETGFEAAEKAKAIKNDFGLDLFLYNGDVYEGRTGVQMLVESDLPKIAEIINKNGGLPKINELIETQSKKTGESPRYTRPDERKKDLFPPRQKDENTIFAKDGYGKKHYYFRFHNEDGVELFTLKNQNDYFHSVFVQCEGYMIGIGSKSSLEDIKERVAGFENGIKGEIERIFNESMANPQKWADPCFAEILGRTDEAKAHNAPIREERELANRQRDAEREAKRIAEEQAAKDEYEQAIKAAERNLLDGQPILNAKIQGKSLIMQLFREHEIAVPLKTQGWIMKSLQSVTNNPDRQTWSYRYRGNDSTVFTDYCNLLLTAVQTKQQYEEMARSGDNSPQFDNHIENEDENDMEI